MNNQECESAFHQLIRVLREAELSWLVEEVLAEIRRGKPQPKKVKVQQFQEFTFVENDAPSTGGKPATFVESVEYTPPEKLAVLISAIERSFVDPCVMEDAVADTLQKSIQQEVATAGTHLAYKFVAEEDEEMDTRISFSNERAKRRELGNSLSRTINRLREAAHGVD